MGCGASSPLHVASGSHSSLTNALPLTNTVPSSTQAGTVTAEVPDAAPRQSTKTEALQAYIVTATAADTQTNAVPVDSAQSEEKAMPLPASTISGASPGYAIVAKTPDFEQAVPANAYIVPSAKANATSGSSIREATNNASAYTVPGSAVQTQSGYVDMIGATAGSAVGTSGSTPPDQISSAAASHVVNGSGAEVRKGSGFAAA